ncbi:MAG: sigma-E factor negative regulatory protein [Pseudomonadales bacterium]|nr:sigma-E factor negative regulatory protein [Pseudomonadales bacterium]
MSEDKHNPSMNELASKLMDGEASEFELRRVLQETDVDAEDCLSKTWSRYHVIQAAMQNELPESVGIDISARISEAIQDEPSYQIEDAPIASTPDSKKSSHMFLRPVANIAVAASVAFAIVFGWETLQNAPDQGAAPQVAQSSNSTLSNPQSSSPQSFQRSPSANYPVGPQSATGPQVVQFNSHQGQSVRSRSTFIESNNLELLSKGPFTKAVADKRALTSEHQQRLNRYFVTHTSQAALNTSQGLMPYVRVVDMAIVDTPIVEYVDK